MSKHIIYLLVLLLFLAGCGQNEAPSAPAASDVSRPFSESESELESSAVLQGSSVSESEDVHGESPEVLFESVPELESGPVSKPAEARPQSSAAAQTLPPAVDGPAQPPAEAAKPATPEAESGPEAEAPAAFSGQGVAPIQSGTTSSLEAELLGLINDARVQRGLSTLGVEESMQFAASIRAEEVLQSLSHTRPDGTPYHTAFDEAGFAYAGKWHGENLAYLLVPTSTLDDTAIAQALFAEWSKSSGHEQNMLSENFLQTGIGVYIDSGEDVTRIGSAQLFAGL